MPKANEIDVEIVRAALSYDPVTGILRWRVSSGSATAGKVAGSKITDQDPYSSVKIDGKRFGCHRVAWVIMTGVWPKHLVDHRNRNKGDNRWENLREATGTLNNMNSRLNSRNRSGYRGVHYCNTRKKWIARICTNRKQRDVGQFATKEEAARAYQAEAARRYGDFHLKANA